MEIIAALVGFSLGGGIVGFVIYSRLKIETQTWKTKFELTQTSAAQAKAESAQLQNVLTLQFKDLAQKIFDEKSTKLTTQNNQQLEGILKPLKEKLYDFEKKVEETYVNEQKDRSHLKGEISKLFELNQTMSNEAKNLTLALKGENKTQGNWGEMILENILERSGLRKGEEFFTQESIEVDGRKLRPDVIVKLPDGKHLIVDSKMTLVAYEASVSAATEPERERYAQAHVDSLKNHIRDLSEKRYHLADSIISPDFVMLFMPLEPAFALAFRLKPEMFEQAWDKNIAIVSPTTLLTTLRTVAALWKQNRQQVNALEIAKRGGELYDKFVGIVSDLGVVGKHLDTARNAHEEVVKKMSTGRGNLYTQVEKLKELGAKAEKSLPVAIE